MSSLLRDPLTHCLLAGALLFAWTAFADRSEERVIHLGKADLARLGAQWESQLGRRPTADELAGLVEEHVREEILVREALRLGLDEDDVVIRRRLAQKFRFVTEDLAVEAPPTEPELEAFHRAEAERYREPARTTFSHVFLRPEGREDATADARAILADDTIETGWRRLGDPFISSRSYVDATDGRIERDFGVDFAEALAAVEPGTWSGPIASEHGLHLVRVRRRDASAAIAHEAVRERVRVDLDAARRRAANEERMAELRARYRVEIEP